MVVCSISTIRPPICAWYLVFALARLHKVVEVLVSSDVPHFPVPLLTLEAPGRESVSLRGLLYQVLEGRLSRSTVCGESTLANTEVKVFEFWVFKTEED